MQGLDSLVAHFFESRFPYGGEKEFLPVRFVPPRDGVRKTFTCFCLCKTFTKL
jgi:hypothetical protein